MKTKNIKLKIKIQNSLMSSGKKSICEKLLLKTTKSLQKSSNKNHASLIKLAVINNAPSIKIKKIKRKRKKLKEFPFIPSKKTRTFFALKFILTYSKKISTNFYVQIEKGILRGSENSQNNKHKENDQEQALKLKKYSHYRWLI